jgi:hypothetical protein
MSKDTPVMFQVLPPTFAVKLPVVRKTGAA